MPLFRCWSFVAVALLPAAVHAAEIAVATLAEGSPRLLRGTDWYKLVAGGRLEDGDIVELAERAQVIAEFPNGLRLSVVGPGALYVEPRSPKGGAGDAVAVTLPAGWLKLAAKPPGVRVRAPSAEVAFAEGSLVAHVQSGSFDSFVESGAGQLAAIQPNGAVGQPQPVKEGEYWSNATGRLAALGHTPKPFLDAMPRAYLDPLPALAARYKSKPSLVADGEVSYAEAEPWLAGRDRAAFEKRFAPRLRDPVFRRAVEPHVARYPAWDRMLHPEKYEPKEAAAK